VSLGAVGATADWLKLTAAHRTGSRSGLTSLEKLLFQIGLSVILAYFTYNYGIKNPESHTLFFPFAKRFGIELPRWAYILLSTLVMTGASNAVNLTDGLDGLAAGCMAICSFAFCILAMIIGTSWSKQFLLNHIPGA